MKTTVELKLIMIFILSISFTYWVREPINRINEDTTTEIIEKNYGGFMKTTEELPRGGGDWPEALTRALFFHAHCLGNNECTLK